MCAMAANEISSEVRKFSCGPNLFDVAANPVVNSDFSFYDLYTFIMFNLRQLRSVEAT